MRKHNKTEEEEKTTWKSWMKFCCCERAARSGCRQSRRFGYFRRPDIFGFYLRFRCPLFLLPRNAVIHPRSLSPDRKNWETLEIGCKCFCSARLICRKKYLNFQKKTLRSMFTTSIHWIPIGSRSCSNFDRKKKSAFLRLHCLSMALIHSFIHYSLNYFWTIK